MVRFPFGRLNHALTRHSLTPTKTTASSYPHYPNPNQVCFITKRYLEKAWGQGPNGDDDNCKFEFDYACRRKGVAKMVTVVMEPGCRNASQWIGTVSGKLGGKLYIDLSTEDYNAFDKAVARLAAEIRSVVAGDSAGGS